MRQIDPQKVLLVVNSSIAQSGVDAADYISRRGLNPAHILSFSFGTVNTRIDSSKLWLAGAVTTILCTTEGYIGKKFCVAIGEYALANKIEAIILSTHTPPRVKIEGDGATSTLAAVASNSIWLKNSLSAFDKLKFYNPAQEYSGNLSSFSPPEVLSDNTFGYSINLNWYPYDNLNNPDSLIPAGRIGCTTAYDLPGLEYAGPSGSSIYNSAVTNALIAEQMDQRNSVHVGTTELMYNPFVTPTENTQNYTWMSSQSGLTNVIRVYYGVGIPVGPTPRSITASITDSQDWIPVSNITYFPTSGVVMMYNYFSGEFKAEQASYTGIDTVNKRLTGVIRGLVGPQYSKGNSTVNPPPYRYSWDAATPILPIEPVGRVQNYYMQYWGLPALDPTIPPFFSLCIGANFNAPSQTYMNSSLTGKVVQGGWGFTWTSNAFLFGQALLYNGGSAAIVSAGEPYAGGLPSPGHIFALAQVYKLPLILANFLALSPWEENPYTYQPNATVIGDPFYAPYKSTPLDNTQFEFYGGGTASGQVGVFNVWGDVTSTSTPNWATLAPTQTPSWAGLNPNINPDWGNINTTAEVLITQSAAYIVTETGDFIAAEEPNPNWGVLTPNTTPNWTEIN